MDPRSRWRADRVLHHVDERGHVVIGDRLACEHRLDEPIVDGWRTLAARDRLSVGHDADRGVGLGSQQLDLEPTLEPGDV
jgi:hypothetical protein